MKKRILLLLPAVLFTLPVVGATDNFAEAFAKCKQVDNDLKRLVCFDSLESPVQSRQQPTVQRSEPVKPQASREVVRQPSPAPQRAVQPERTEQVKTRQSQVNSDAANNTDDFGLKPKVPVAEVDEIGATIIAITESARGKLYVELDNGSKWQQRDSQHMKLETGMQVKIERGFLGSFFLSHDGSNRRMKVKRVN